MNGRMEKRKGTYSRFQMDFHSVGLGIIAITASFREIWKSRVNSRQHLRLNYNFV